MILYEHGSDIPLVWSHARLFLGSRLVERLRTARGFSPFIQLGVLLLSILPSARWYGSILGLLLSFGEDWQSRLEDKVADVGTDIDILIPGLDVDGDDALKSCVRAIQRHATPGARRSDSKCLPWSSFKKFLDHITCT